METLKEKWKKLDTIATSRQIYEKTVLDIENKKKQKITGKKSAEYLITCAACKKEIKIAFTGVNTKKKEFICFDCQASY